MINDPCVDQNTGRRRIFWTTVDSCGSYVQCGEECSLPGLRYINQPEGRTIESDRDQWLRSLILNILNTRARTAAPCPTPMAVFGHWSESYRDDKLYVGSRLYETAEKPYNKITDAVKAIGAAIRADMGKLLILKLAENVEVEVTYKGGNRVDVVIATVVRNVRHVLNLSGTYASDSWVWH
jgi:hypothetical protein